MPVEDGVREREESTAPDVRLPRTEPSKSADGGGGDLFIFYGRAGRNVSVHLWSAWQQKPGANHRYSKDTISKKMFPGVLLRICVSVCELKKSQPKHQKVKSKY